MRRQVDYSAIWFAYEHIQRTNDPIRKTARMFGVHESTLRKRVHNPDLLFSRVGHPTIFSMEEEAELANYCHRMTRFGYGYCRWQVLNLAANMIEETGKSHVPKKHWYYSFVKRHPDLEINKPNKMEVSRLHITSQANIDAYFKELEFILEKYGLKDKPEAVWNIDETGILLHQNPPKIIYATRHKPFTVAAGHGEMTTIIAAGSALGDTLAPYVISKGQVLSGDLTLGGLPGSKYTNSRTGWPTSLLLGDFLFNHFATNIQTRPCLLLYDGHSTHISTRLIEKARENDLHLFVLPPHPTLKPHLSEVDIFSPFKSAVYSECHKLSPTKNKKQITRKDISRLILKTYESGSFGENLMSAFRETGLMPFDPASAAPLEHPVQTDNVTKATDELN